MQDSIFTKIIKGELPCHKVYEDELTLAFMDLHPIQPGHVLLVTKVQVGNFYELKTADYQAFYNSIRLIAQKLHKEFPEKNKVGVMIEGLEVEHVHAKIFPINTGAEYRSEPDMSSEPDHPALAAMAERLKLN